VSRPVLHVVAMAGSTLSRTRTCGMIESFKKKRFDALRAGVEKLAAPLSQNSLNRDAFHQLGLRHMQPGGLYTSLGTAANGSCLPLLMPSSARVGVRDLRRPAFNEAATVRLEEGFDDATRRDLLQPAARTSWLDVW